MNRRAVSTMCVLLLALTLAACGSSKKSTSSGSKATTTSTAAEAAPDSTADKAKADAINLTAADLPGYTSTPADKTSSAETDKELYTCAGLSDPATSTTADESSPDFSKGEFTQVSSEAQFAKTAAQAKKDLDAIKAPSFSACLKQAFDKAMTKQASGAGGTIGASTVESQPGPSGTDGSAAFRMTVPITAVGQTFTFYIDFVLMLKKRAEVTLVCFNGNAPFDAALKGELTDKLISRMASNA